MEIMIHYRNLHFRYFNFNSYVYLKLTCTGIKPFECDICQGCFSSNVALTEHRSRHLGEKPYQCKQCGKQMRHSSSYKRHMMTHSNDLPYQCKHCLKRFAQAPYLRSHMKVHTGEKRQF